MGGFPRQILHSSPQVQLRFLTEEEKKARLEEGRLKSESSIEVLQLQICTFRISDFHSTHVVGWWIFISYLVSSLIAFRWSRVDGPAPPCSAANYCETTCLWFYGKLGFLCLMFLEFFTSRFWYTERTGNHLPVPNLTIGEALLSRTFWYLFSYAGSSTLHPCQSVSRSVIISD